jgi:hypothetical protein
MGHSKPFIVCWKMKGDAFQYLSAIKFGWVFVSFMSDGALLIRPTKIFYIERMFCYRSIENTGKPGLLDLPVILSMCFWIINMW